MPRRKKKQEDDDSSYSAEPSEDSNEEDEEEYVEEEEYKEEEDYKEDEEEEKKKKKTAPKALTKPKKRKRKTYELTDEDFLPSHARKTTNGGYAHTNHSKSKISQANRGNTPWNKGRNRSSADRAKIAAGVRARNRAILLEKLKRLGMSEEEWLQKKKEIKYLRERIRRSKNANAKHKAAEAELKLKAAIEATTEKTPPAGESNKTAPNNASSTAKEKKKEKEISKESKEKAAKEKTERDKVFSKDIVWTPYKFGEEGEDYDQACPTGGPGGLICCDDCTKKYSLYMSRTVKDIEIQRTHKVGNEAKEILEFLGDGTKTLGRAIGVAKKKVPPLPPRRVPTAANGKQPPRKTSTSKTGASTATEWNLTSTIDIGVTGGVEAV